MSSRSILTYPACWWRPRSSVLPRRVCLGEKGLARDGETSEDRLGKNVLEWRKFRFVRWHSVWKPSVNVAYLVQLKLPPKRLLPALPSLLGNGRFSSTCRRSSLLQSCLAYRGFLMTCNVRQSFFQGVHLLLSAVLAVKSHEGPDCTRFYRDAYLVWSQTLAVRRAGPSDEDNF